MLKRWTIGMTAGVLFAAGCAGEPPADGAAPSAAVQAQPSPTPVAGRAAGGEASAAGEQAGSQPAGSYTDLTVPELQALLAEADPQLVNVHIPFEGDLPGTDTSIPFDQVEIHAEHVFLDRDAPIVLYCRSGRMSTIAAEVLARKGYTRVYNLVGGFNAWTAAGLPMAEP